MKRDNAIEIARTVRGRNLRIKFQKIAKEILGARYSLSVVLCGDALARKLNRTYRKKDAPANVLSFGLSKIEGEIFINVRCAEREAAHMHIPTRARVAHLFAHGCLHLKGMRHGEKMDAEELRILKRFSFGK